MKMGFLLADKEMETEPSSLLDQHPTPLINIYTQSSPLIITHVTLGKWKNIIFRGEKTSWKPSY